MKSFSQFINESRHVPQDIISMSNYVFDILKDLVNTPSDDPKYKTKAYELFKEYDNEYDIEVNFKDIPNFNWSNYQLIPGNLLPDFGYDCDFVVRLEDLKDTYGMMDTGEPILSFNVNMLKTPKTFDKKISQIKNTLMHEFTHYVQYMGGLLTGNRSTAKSTSYIEGFYDELEKVASSYKYRLVAFLAYAFTDNERYARVSGFYGTVITEFNDLMKKYKKENKKDPTKEEFIEYVINNDKYNDTEIHTGFFKEIIEMLESDTYENYLACIEDKNTIMRDDSMVYVWLNITDHLDPKPRYMLPSVKTCIYNTRTEAEYERVRTGILNNFKKNLKPYIRNLKTVVSDIWDENNK